jgi:hypothetical protein
VIWCGLSTTRLLIEATLFNLMLRVFKDYKKTSQLTNPSTSIPVWFWLKPRS